MNNPKGNTVSERRASTMVGNLTLAYVSGAVRKVYELRDDPEAAHDAEDRLHQEVLKAIANGYCENPASCAQQALMTKVIDFPRWCA